MALFLSKLPFSFSFHHLHFFVIIIFLLKNVHTFKIPRSFCVFLANPIKVGAKTLPCTFKPSTNIDGLTFNFGPYPSEVLPGMSSEFSLPSLSILTETTGIN